MTWISVLLSVKLRPTKNYAVKSRTESDTYDVFPIFCLDRALLG